MKRIFAAFSWSYLFAIDQHGGNKWRNWVHCMVKKWTAITYCTPIPQCARTIVQRFQCIDHALTVHFIIGTLAIENDAPQLTLAINWWCLPQCIDNISKWTIIVILEGEKRTNLISRQINQCVIWCWSRRSVSLPNTKVSLPRRIVLLVHPLAIDSQYIHDGFA